MKARVLIAIVLALVSLVATARALWPVVRARRGSVVARAHARCSWLVVASLVALAALGASFVAHPTAAFVVGVGSAGAIAVVLACDVAALLAVRVALRGGRLGSSVDFGVGDELRRVAETGAATYRDGDRVVEEHRGSAKRAHDVLRRMIGVDTVLFVVAVGALAVEAWAGS